MEIPCSNSTITKLCSNLFLTRNLIMDSENNIWWHFLMFVVYTRAPCPTWRLIMMLVMLIITTMMMIMADNYDQNEQNGQNNLLITMFKIYWSKGLKCWSRKETSPASPRSWCVLPSPPSEEVKTGGHPCIINIESAIFKKKIINF